MNDFGPGRAPRDSTCQKACGTPSLLRRVAPRQHRRCGVAGVGTRGPGVVVLLRIGAFIR